MATAAEIQKALKRLDASARLPADMCPPIERRLEQGMAQINMLRAWGLTWPQIALGLPSWKQKDGTAVTHDQLRGAVSRIRAKQKPTRKGSRPSSVAAATHAAPTAQAQLRQIAPAPVLSGEKSSLSAQLALTRKSRNVQGV